MLDTKVIKGKVLRYPTKKREIKFAADVSSCRMPDTL